MFYWNILVYLYYLSARSHISGNGATIPSIENTPSVTISLVLQPSDSFNFSSKSGNWIKSIIDIYLSIYSIFDQSIRYFLQYSVILLAILPSMSLLAYRYFLALQSRIPSIMEAWLSASEITASSGPTSCSNKPAFASKQLAYNIVSSLSWNLEIFSSNSYKFCNEVMILIP